MNKKYLQSSEHAWGTGATFEQFEVLGSYNPMHFVLRLSPDIHNRLSTVTPGIRHGDELDGETTLAFSTYFHETIHWWQHIGTNIGLLLSLSYPAQSHVNHTLLKGLLGQTGPVKSLMSYDLNVLGVNSNEDVNRVLNNHHDIEFGKLLMFFPLRAEQIAKRKYYECMGHSYVMLWSTLLWLLASTFDQNHHFIPDPRVWESHFLDLKKRKVEGYYWGSPIRVTPLGVRELFEGQARFSQIQYLYNASGRSLTWKDCDGLGLLSGVYIEAFKAFLVGTGSEWPSRIDDPIVGLFLLVCDVALNPTEGFPFDLINYEAFIISSDPGIRFYICSKMIGEKKKSLKTLVQKFNYDEYESGCCELCEMLKCPTPLDSARRVERWASSQDSLGALLSEESSFRFSDENQPVRVFFSQFIRFQQDKVKRPDYFCWPGFHSAGELCSEETSRLFMKHEALFTGGVDEIIRPRVYENKEGADVQAMFENFYAWNILYDLYRQWVMADGPFEYDYDWLTTRFEPAVMKNWACERFEAVYGVHPDNFQII